MSTVRSLDQYVYGSGDDNKDCLLDRIRSAWELARTDALKEKVGKECDLISVIGNIEGKEPRSLINREVKVTETPEAVATWLRKELELDPGPAFVGTIRFYFRIFGASENGKLGSFQREIRAAELPVADPGTASIVAIQTAILTPVLERLLAQSDGGTRMLVAHAATVEHLVKGMAILLDILKGNRVADVEGNPILAFLGQAMSAAGGAGVPGATQAGQAVTTLARAAGPPTVVPDLSSRLGVTRSVVPEFGVSGGPTGSSPSSSPTPSSSAAPKAVTTRADVDRWVADNPKEAEEMVKQKLRERGFPI